MGRTPTSVVALGDGVENAARALASRTGRPLAPPARSLDEIDLATSPMLVTLTHNVDLAFLDALYTTPEAEREAPGLVFDATPERLEVRVEALARSMAAECTAQRLLELLPTTSLEERRIGRRHLVGGRTDPQRIRQIVTEPAALVSIVSHSNGFDLHLGGGLSFCDAVHDRGRSAAGAPCCRITGECFRHHQPIELARSGGKIVLPQELQARIVFFYSCAGLRGDPSERDWMFTNALLLGGRTAAVITGWSVLIPGDEGFEVVVKALYRGRTVGEAVAAINRRRGGTQLAVLGDPRARVDPLPETEIEGLRFRQADEPVPGDGGRFLHVLTHAASEDDAHPQGKALALVAAHRVAEYERIMAQGFASAQGEPAGTLMREAVLAWLGHFGSLVSQFWLPLTRGERGFDRVPCRACGTRAKRFRFVLRPAGLPPRELVICPRCGIRSDATRSAALDMILDGRTVELVGELPESSWTALAHFGCQDRERSVAVPWPADAAHGGRPVRRFTPRARWPPGPLIISVALVTHSDLTVLSAYGTGDS